MVEIYNPNPVMTFGGIGSKKLVGGDVEYIVNNDSHPGAQYNSEFRSLVKSEIARLSTEVDLDTARAEPQGSDQSDQLQQADRANIQVDRQKLVELIGSDNATPHGRCNIAAIVQTNRNEKPDELTQKILDSLCADQQ